MINMTINIKNIKKIMRTDDIVNGDAQMKN